MQLMPLIGGGGGDKIKDRRNAIEELEQKI